MGTTALRQYLRSLCNNTHWNYAVFWKLNHQTPFILTWEDGYYDHPKPTKIVWSASDNIYFNGAKSLPFSSCEPSMDDYASVGCPIELSVTNMSSLQFALGERSVGEVAYTGEHRWVFSNSLFTGESDLELVPDDEWLLQFALGVKTILLVPVLPDGVLQLGSLEVVAEDLGVVVSVKDSFNYIRNVMEKAVPFMLKSNIVHHQSSLSPLSRLVEDIDEPLIENIDEPSGLLVSTLKTEKSEDVDSIRVKENRYSNLKQWVPVPTVQDMLLVSGKDVPSILKRKSQNEIDIPEESTLPSQSSQLELLDSKMFELSCLQEELQAYTTSSGYNMELFGESFNGVDSFSVGDREAELFGDYNTYDGSYNFLSFPENCELHKALGHAFQIKTNDQPWDSSLFVQDSCTSSSLIYNKDFVDTIQAPQVTKTSDTKFMLDSSVVANLCGIADDSSSSLSDGVWSYTSSSRQFSTSQPQTLSSTNPWMKNIPKAGILDASSFLARDKTSSSFNSTMNPLPDKEMQVNDYSHLHPRKGKKSNVKTSRVKNGNNPKPRPRDRQLIQDRVKELRELVPDGSKCSIDGLLDHTIKHMLYLRCVTDQAEKLKRYMNQESTSWKNMESSENEKSFQNGTSLAFEFGSETHVCPIVVEDLEYPGHMLIEMQCDGHGHFLEITQVIRRLELTIVKGVMEKRSNSTWAHIVIEASKGFHRMDIFWPLLHLLQRRKNPISSKI